MGGLLKLETHKGNNPYSKNDEEYGVANPMDAIAGLRCVVKSLMDYFGSGEKYDKYKMLNEKCPDIPIGKNNESKPVFLPHGLVYTMKL